MKIKNLSLNSLIEYENNPRDNDVAVDAVAASIKEFGCIDIIKIPIEIFDEFRLSYENGI